MTNKVYLVAQNSTANGFILLAVAIYLGVIIWQGNLTAFVTTLWADISGKQVATSGASVTVTATKGPAFWQWLVALLVLYVLASNPTTEPYFGPFLAIMLVALLIQLATNQPALFANLNTAIQKVFPKV